MLRIAFALNCLLALLYPVAASAWSYQGHKVVGSIADKLLKPNAKEQVRQILAENDPRRLGELNLQKAAPWPDCVKSVVRHDDKTFHYEVDPEHLEYEVPCTPFNSKKERARLEDYAKRNWTQNKDDSNIFGLEPNFGCCTANLHQGWPKFVSHMWMAAGHDDLAVAIRGG